MPLRFYSLGFQLHRFSAVVCILGYGSGVCFSSVLNSEPSVMAVEGYCSPKHMVWSKLSRTVWGRIQEHYVFNVSECCIYTTPAFGDSWGCKLSRCGCDLRFFYMSEGLQITTHGTQVAGLGGSGWLVFGGRRRAFSRLSPLVVLALECTSRLAFELKAKLDSDYSWAVVAGWRVSGTL